MKCLLFALSLALLLSSNTVVANVGMQGLRVTPSKAAMLFSKAKQTGGKVLVAASLFAATCGIITGCSDQMQAGKAMDMVTSSEPEEFLTLAMPYSNYMPYTLRGAELAVEQINAAGGINNTPINLLSRNHYSSASAAYENVEYGFIVEAEVPAQVIIGPSTSYVAEVLDELAQAYRLPMIAVGPTSPGVTAAGDYVFLSSSADDKQGLALAMFAADELGAKTAAVLTLENFIDSESLGDAFTAAFTAAGGKIVAHVEYPSYYGLGNYAYFIAQLSKKIPAVVAAKPEVIFIPGLLYDSLSIAKLVKEADTDAVLLGGAGWDIGNIARYGREYVEGAYFSVHFTADDPNLNDNGKQFVADYAAKYEEEPNSLAALAFNAVNLAKEAARRATMQTGNSPAELSGTDIRDALVTIKDYRDYGGVMHSKGFNADRHLIQDGVIIKFIEDGEAKYFTTIEP